MDKKMTKSIKAALLLGVYILILWIGFRSGEIYNRMKKKLVFEKIIVSLPPTTRYYYIVEIYGHKGYREVALEYVPDTDTRIRFFLNEKMRPLLKLRDIKIYTQKGDRIY